MKYNKISLEWGFILTNLNKIDFLYNYLNLFYESIKYKKKWV